MKKASLCIALITGFAVLLVVGCGQTGPLYLPQSPQAISKVLPSKASHSAFKASQESSVQSSNPNH